MLNQNLIRKLFQTFRIQEQVGSSAFYWFLLAKVNRKTNLRNLRCCSLTFGKVVGKSSLKWLRLDGSDSLAFLAPILRRKEHL